MAELDNSRLNKRIRQLEGKIEELEKQLCAQQVLAKTQQEELNRLGQHSSDLQQKLGNITSSFTYRLALTAQRVVAAVLSIGKKRPAEPTDTSPDGEQGVVPEELLPWPEYRFYTYKKNRERMAPFRLDAIQTPCHSSLVSIVLPVYNGGEMLRSSLDSILLQTYTTFELIVVNDGSTDQTTRILDEYAKKDSRIKVISQENKKLPQSLSNGFALAKGEFLTWTSADNTMPPDFLEKMVFELRAYPETGMVFANMNLIDEKGAPLTNFGWYADENNPQTMLLPRNMLPLNTEANNYIGAAFLYRSVVSAALGAYSPVRFTTEDYDYWMRVNEVFNLRHTDFEEPVYDYRIHSGSLTAKREEMQIDKHRARLMIWDEFRRYFLLRPLAWLLDGFVYKPVLAWLETALRGAGHTVLPDEKSFAALAQNNYTAPVYVAYGLSAVDPACLSGTCFKVYVADAPCPVSAGWDCCVSLSPVGPNDHLPEHRGWFSFEDGQAMFAFLDAKAKSTLLQRMEHRAETQTAWERDYTCVIAYLGDVERLRSALRAAAALDYPKDRYEILVAALAKEWAGLQPLLDEVNRDFANGAEHFARLVLAPDESIAETHTAAAWQSHGEWTVFLSADAVCDANLLNSAKMAVQYTPTAKVVCGQTLASNEREEAREERFFPWSGWEEYRGCGCLCVHTQTLLQYGFFGTHELGVSHSSLSSLWEAVPLADLARQGFAVCATGLSQTLQEVLPVSDESVWSAVLNRYHLETLGLALPTTLSSMLQEIAAIEAKQAVGEEISSFFTFRRKALVRLITYIKELQAVRADSNELRRCYSHHGSLTRKRGVLPLVSVIVPVYDIKDYLARCVSSIAAQTYPELEVILVDDGSTDGSGVLCDELQKVDDRIRVIHKENGGLSSARNVGVEAAGGELFTFVDGDDWLDKDMLEILYLALKAEDADIAECTYTEIFKDGTKPQTSCSGKRVVAKPFDALLDMYNWRHFLPMAWGKLYTKQAVGEVRYPEGSMHEDEFTTWKMHLNGAKAVYIDVSKYNYDRTRDEAITSQKYDERRLDAVDAYRERMFTLWELGAPLELEAAANSNYVWMAFHHLELSQQYGINGPKVDMVARNVREDLARMQEEKRPIKDEYASWMGKD